MGVIRVVSMAELHLSDAGQIEANWQSLSNEQLVSLAPSGRSLEQLKRELADGSRVILSDTPILPLFRYQSGEWITNIQEGISPHAVNQIQKRFASAGSSAHFKTSTGSLAPAIEPVYSPDPSLTQIAPTTAPTAKISPKFAQARRRLELELVYDDKEETAAGKVPYRVEFSDGSQKSGVLNAKGWACLEDCPNGEATVIFGDEAERQSAEQRLPDLYRQLAASLDTAAAEMAKKSEQLAAQADVQQISDSFRQKVDAQLAELTAQREQFNQQQIWQQALQTGQAYTQGLSQGTACFMDDLLDFSGLMAFLEEAEISLSLLLEAIMTGDVDALEAKLAQWRVRSENGLKATGEAMEMLILLLKDEYVRALLQSLPLRYLDALPKDKLAEIAGYMHSRVSLDGMLEMSLVLLAALVGSVFGVILMFLVVTKKRASRIISPASSVLEDIAKAQKAIRNDHAIQTYIGKHQTPLNSKAPEGDVDTPLKSQENPKGVPSNPNRGLTFVVENLGMPRNSAMQNARDFESGTTGAFSEIATRQRQVPALRYDNPNPNGAPFVKFDGYQQLDNGVIELIDSKTRIVPFSTREGPFISPSVRDGLVRKSEALSQNSGYRGVIELPTIEARREAQQVLRKLGITNISTRVRQ
ncbi:MULTISPECIES: hypothetical protein [Shewanella]|uniref:SPOR domain-containing protein n=1 Tax=bacterium 19CA01SA08 TaxID=2920574 RepID=A0AAU6VPY1_UNCXX|nr:MULTISPECIES: hypothetical protein [Shewanella]MDE0568211.1 hypothetical protein [Shewanella sp. K8]TVO96817.1 hypothetical protein AYI86_13260 [Shewanella algae]